MSEALVGLRVSVLLIQPSNERIEGRVVRVQNRQLFLDETFYVARQSYGQTVVIPGQDIADIEVIPSLPPVYAPREDLRSTPRIQQSNVILSRSATPLSNAPNGRGPRPLPPPVTSEPFTDPAILSYAKPSLSATQEMAVLLTKQADAQRTVEVEATDNTSNLTATLSKPFNNMSLGGMAPSQAPESAGALVEHDLTSHRPRRRKLNRQSVADDGNSSPELTRPQLVPTQAANGWRDTPLLEEIPASKPSATVAATVKGRKSKPKRQKAFGTRADDGFITEETTDIQAMEDFDFVGNLSKFDKKAVFDQLRSEDTTTDAELLVTHNRIAKPGTFEGTKLHPFENVLQAQRRDSKDMYDSDEDYDTVDALGSRPPHRASSRSSSKRRVMQRVASRTSDSSHQKNDSARIRGRDSLTGTGSSPRPSNKAVLRYSSGRTAPCVWPDDLRESEELALSEEYWLTEDLIIENAGRAIADLALSTISPDGRRFAPGNHNTRPVVVILVWDEWTAAKGIAAGRHLQSRGIRVIASVADKRMIRYEDDETAFASQMYRFKGAFMSWVDTADFLKTLDAPPELIIDALSGTKDLMSSLLNHEEPDHVNSAVFQMMAWANKSRASCLAIDCPFGVHPSTGSIQVYEGEPAEIRAKVVACCGAPVSGLLGALHTRHHEGAVDEWKVFICDTGINPALKQVTRGSLGRGYGRGIAFGSSWIVKVRFEPPEATV